MSNAKKISLKLSFSLLSTLYLLLFFSNAFAYEVSGYDWTYMSNPMGEDYYINPNCQDTDCGTAEQQIAAIKAGARAWNNEGNANFEFTYGGQTLNTGPYFNNRNEIWFEVNDEPWAGRTYTWVDDEHGYPENILECDLAFNDYYNWNVIGNLSYNELDVWSVAAHEFGHWLSLEHEPDVEDATMYSNVIYGDTRMRDLHSDDIAGIQAIYDPASNTNPVLTTAYVTPGTGTEGITNFVYRVHYYDADTDAPSQGLVYIDGNPLTMSLESGTSSDGTYSYETTLSGSGSHNYYFYFQDTQGGDDQLPVLEPNTGPYVNPAPADIDVRSRISKKLAQDTTGRKILKIYNRGGQDLTFEVTESVDKDWLKVKSGQGTIEPGGMHKVKLLFDATGLLPDSYVAWLKIDSNDPDESTVWVKVTLKVVAP